MAFVPVLSGTLNFIHYQLYIEYLYINLPGTFKYSYIYHVTCQKIFIHKLSIAVNIHNVLCYIICYKHLCIHAFDTSCYGNYTCRYFDSVPKFTVSFKIYIDVRIC